MSVPFHGQYEKVIDTLLRHLSLETAKWEIERAASMRFLARCYLVIGRPLEARRWLFRALGEAPSQREPYGEFARVAYFNREYQLAVWLVEEALKITEKPNYYLDEKFCWDEILYDMGGVCAYYVGMLDKAYQYTKTALEMAPGDTRIKENYRLIVEKIEESKEV